MRLTGFDNYVYQPVYGAIVYRPLQIIVEMLDMIVVSYQNETKIKKEFTAQQPGDEIELIMTDSSFPNGQETRTFITQQSRKISQNSSNS